MLEILVAQAEAQAQAIRNLTALCRQAGVPQFRLAQALRPLVMDLGAVPSEEHDGNTEPLERDDPRELEAIRAADHIPTQELRVVTDEDLEAVS